MAEELGIWGRKWETDGRPTEDSSCPGGPSLGHSCLQGPLGAALQPRLTSLQVWASPLLGPQAGLGTTAAAVSVAPLSATPSCRSPASSPSS